MKDEKKQNTKSKPNIQSEADTIVLHKRCYMKTNAIFLIPVLLLVVVVLFSWVNMLTRGLV